MGARANTYTVRETADHTVMANEGHAGLQDLAGVSRIYPPVHNTCLPDLPPEVVAAKRERPKSWLPCEFLTSSCVRKLYNKLSLLLITCSKRFGPFRTLSESHSKNGIGAPFGSGIFLREDHKHSSMYRFTLIPQT